MNNHLYLIAFAISCLLASCNKVPKTPVLVNEPLSSHEANIDLDYEQGQDCQEILANNKLLAAELDTLTLNYAKDKMRLVRDSVWRSGEIARLKLKLDAHGIPYNDFNRLFIPPPVQDEDSI